MSWNRMCPSVGTGYDQCGTLHVKAHSGTLRIMQKRLAKSRHQK